MNRICLFFLSLWILGNGGVLTRAQAQDFSPWHFYADATIHPQADDSFEAVYVDFTRLLQRDLKRQGQLDESAIRVAPLDNGQAGAVVPHRFIRDSAYDATKNACGTLVFLATGTNEPGERRYRIFFDTLANGKKPAHDSQTTEVPPAANMIWNGDFEILTANYTGSNRYKNDGPNMPHGWWGNLRNSKVLANLANEAYSGKHALAFGKPEAGKNIGIATAPSPPALRVVPGQNYIFSFRAKGEELTPSRTILIAYVYWYGKDQQYLSRVQVNGLPENRADFPWMKGETIVPAPTAAHYASLWIGTYSATGMITLDALEARPAVPPLLENAKANS